MRITLSVLLYVIEIYYQQCCGLNFIDLPGFGSDEKSEIALMKMDKEKENKENKFTSSVFQDAIVSSDDSDSDKQAQKNEQSIERRKSLTLRTSFPKELQVNSTSSSVITPTETTKSTISENSEKTSSQTKPNGRLYPPVRPTPTIVTIPNYRRHWLIRNPPPIPPPEPQDDKDENIKSKITMLVQQTMHDTEARMKSVQKLKEKHREEAPYRVGFILSMIKKSRDVLNELFNVAVKHRDEWKALEQLKIFELIVHTNVDTTNLVRQLVEIHIQSLNATAQGQQSTTTTLQATPPREPDIPKLRSDQRKLKNKVVLL